VSIEASHSTCLHIYQLSSVAVSTEYLKWLLVKTLVSVCTTDPGAFWGDMVRATFLVLKAQNSWGVSLLYELLDGVPDFHILMASPCWFGQSDDVVRNIRL